MTDDPEKFRKMDKKNSFPIANVNKALTLDSSSKAAAYTRQDGTSGSQVSKVQQRTPSRYKGGFSSNPNNSRNESSNRSKQNLPRGRGNLEKRGKLRSGGGGCGGGPSPAEPVVDRKNEPGSLQSPGGKKQNFDDLWGFHFAPRGTRDRGYSHDFTNARSHPPGGGHWRQNHMSGPSRAKFAKDYLLANCQFLVRLGEDYTVYLADPNLLVTWDLIEQVRIRFDGEMPKCPICLDFPIAAKITKCGHIYCWSCFLHYLALSDLKVRTCPICYEPVFKKDLKSVSLLPLEPIHIGSKIEMRLMSRMKDSCVAYPFEKFPSWETKFCKILQISPEAIIHNILNRERAELDFVFATDPTAPEVCFIQEALNELVEREVTLSAKQIEFGELDTSTNGLFPPNVIFGNGSVQEIEDTVETTMPEALALSPEKGNSRKKTRNDSVGSNSSMNDETFPASKLGDGQGHCYFYQILDGRNVFLHPMNMAMLWRELGPDPEKWPQVLTFDVIDIESRSATDEVRKRMKLVRHLPKNTPFDLVEVSMEEWGISPQVYADFSSQIRQRDQRRKNRAKEERIFEKKQREREAMEFGKLKHLPVITSSQEFPAFGSSSHGSNLASFPEEMIGLDGAIAIEPEGEAPSDESLPAEPYSTASSFAQIAGMAPIKKSPTFPLPVRSMWGKNVTPVKAPTSHPGGRHSDSENDCEDYIPVPDYRTSVSDAIEKAMAGLALAKSEAQGSADVDAEGGMSTGGNKKKKNKKGTVVFALGMGPFN